MWKQYYNLTKPGIVCGNLLTTIAAYVYASRWTLVSWPTWMNLFGTIVGLGLVIASACVFNNYFDRDIDQKMTRTKDRALASGAISNINALLFGAILGLLGFAALVGFVHVLTALIALVGFLVYVFAYTFLKRKTDWATEVGSIAGAMPVVAGYAAVMNRLDWAAFILFLVLVFWQMPHFYAIAMRRFDDYTLAELPVLPRKKGTREATLWAMGYILAFALAVFALTAFGFAGYWYLVIVEIAALVWFWYATTGFRTESAEAWARRFFHVSLSVLLVFSVMLSLAAVLP